MGRLKNKTKKENKKGSWKKVGSILESNKFDGHYFKADDEDLMLLIADKKTGKYYQIKSLSLFDPSDKAPDFVTYNVSVNLESEYQVAPLEDDDDASDDVPPF